MPGRRNPNDMKKYEVTVKVAVTEYTEKEARERVEGQLWRTEEGTEYGPIPTSDVDSFEIVEVREVPFG